MFLKKSKSNGKTYLSFVEGYRKDGKVKQKTVKKIGYLEELEGKYSDPVEYFTRMAKEETRIKKQAVIREQEYYENILKAPVLELSTAMEEVKVSSKSDSVMIFRDEYSEEKAEISPEHWHRTLQFTIVVKGNLDVSVNGQKYSIYEKECVLLNSNALHKIEGEGIAYTIHVLPSFICTESDITLYSKYLAPFLSNPSFTCVVFQDINEWQKEILEILSDIIERADKKEFTYELEIKALLIQIWAKMIKNIKCSVPNEEEIKIRTERVKLMIEYIHINYQKRISVKEIALAANISESECGRCFQKILQQSPIEFLIRYRITCAYYMLASTDKTITEIAESCGFEDPSYFFRTFKKYTGMTPGEYRKLKNKE